MEYVKFGRSGLKVSKLAFGTVNLGRLITPKASHRLLDEVIDTGINFIDTADEYSYGLCERIIGDWLQQNPAKRDKIVLSTKVFEPVGHEPNDAGLSAYHIKRACEASLKRLQTDHIDLYQMHHVDRNTPWPEMWQAMEHLIREGKITYVGSSNFAAWHIAQAQAYAEQKGLLGILSEQSVYSLARRTVEMEVLPACQNMGIAFLAYSPLEEGILAGGLTKAQANAARHSPEQDARFIVLLDKMGVASQQKEGHPLTQFYREYVYPELQQQQQRLAVESLGESLPEMNRADYSRQVLQQIVATYGDDLSEDEKQFFIEYGITRELGDLSRGTFWRSMLKVEQWRKQLEAYDAFCHEYSFKSAELALAWLNHQPAVTSVIIGPRTSAHLRSCVSSLSLKLDNDVRKKLDAIFPGFRTAPEEYAW